jgi:hypothetical protein
VEDEFLLLLLCRCGLGVLSRLCDMLASCFVLVGKWRCSSLAVSLQMLLCTNAPVS